MIQTIDGIQFKAMVLHGAAAIALQKQQINDLNVFPVPDGDTGTNMSLTIGTAATELKKKDDKAVDQAAATTAGALLRGARGNSGVILSLLFRGLSKGLKGCQTADGTQLAAAMQEGVAAAYGAVMKPAEGTVLTVSRLAAKRAVEAAAENSDVEYVLEEAIREGYDVLAQTTDMNPVLKKAGVVDAGGKGYLVILEGMLASLRGEALPQVPEEGTAPAENEGSAFEKFDTADIKFAYCTEFIIERKNNKNPGKLRAFLEGLGDSLVLVDDDEIIKVHVHTNHPGMALEEALTYGSLMTTKIENMKNQHSEILSEVKNQAEEESEAVAAPEKRYGFLSVCAGEGLANVFRDLGADGIISGGQTMNPSTESILKEINKVPAEVVFVLPNNKNIIMAAQQCIGLTPKEVVVVPTATIPQGITAMMSVDLELEPQELLDTMSASIANVATAQITYAARNSDFDGFAINEGDYLSLMNGKLFGTDKDIAVLLEKLAQEAAERKAEFVTVFYGEDVTEEQAAQAEEIFSRVCPGAELSVLPGGQPVYYYIISIE